VSLHSDRSTPEPVLDLNHQPSTGPRLVAESAGTNDWLTIALTDARLLVGRSPSAQVRLIDPSVSKTHALLEREGGDVFLSDLGSLAGTALNGRTVDRRMPLRHGDLLRFGPVLLRYQNSTGSTGGTGFIAGRQYGHQLNNVGRDQHNHFKEERDSFLRELAATRSKANWCTVAGFLLAILGLAGWMAVFFNFIPASQSWFDGSQKSLLKASNGPPPILPLPSPLGPKIAGVPAGIIAFAACFVGTVLIVVGIALHVVVVARRRQFDRTLEAPWRPT